MKRKRENKNMNKTEKINYKRIRNCFKPQYIRNKQNVLAFLTFHSILLTIDRFYVTF